MKQPHPTACGLRACSERSPSTQLPDFRQLLKVLQLGEILSRIAAIRCRRGRAVNSREAVLHEQLGQIIAGGSVGKGVIARGPPGRCMPSGQ